MDWAIGLQERAGLPVVTDGEMRRESFQSQMVEATDGFGEHDIDAWLWGEWHGDGAVGDKTTERPQTLGVVGKLQAQAPPLGRGVRVRAGPHGEDREGHAAEPEHVRQPLVP